MINCNKRSLAIFKIKSITVIINWRPNRDQRINANERQNSKSRSKIKILLKNIRWLNCAEETPASY
uniref:RE43210p n=1 Tax=Drosophila melanogaster TaxID=7227 RepID=Q8MYZ1_DROME|nr:RE43210p [Drosophila melanogaster]